MVSFKKSLFSLGIAVAALAVLPCQPSHADPACDATFLTDMENRAWAEAQREIMIAESTIAKPDSVFELTCFNGLLGQIPGSAFSGSSWSSDLSDIQSTVSSYVGGAFVNTFGEGHDTAVTNSLGAFACDKIRALWNDARCANLATATIRTLADMDSYDRGAYPTACGSVTLTTATTLTSTYDAMNLFLGVTAPLSETSGTKCSAGIKTGVTVGTGTDPEIVCPNPGCSPTGGAAPKCCQTGTTAGATCS
ncbi:MAG: hypothetical protein WC043_06865 [Pseudobdellovibrionaceae bacterium]